MSPKVCEFSWHTCLPFRSRPPRPGMLWGLFFLLRVRPVSALGCPCHRDQQLPPHPVNYTWLIPQSHQTPGISFSWKPRLPRQLLSARHHGLRPSPAPLLLALWLKSPLTEMNSKAALISPAGSPLRSPRSRRRTL